MASPELDDSQRFEAVRIAAILERYDVHGRQEAIHAELAILREKTLLSLGELSRDPAVLGDVLGDYIHKMVMGTQGDAVRYWPVMELLRAAGADEQRARERARQLHEAAS
ncbi:hypothetical protein [Actinoplanes sp. NPDC051859]|uniref:hypothetical protein n=1 Tax=Actinoplanes sp. NPDC051859 TaxID=3363909 RepID=UPI003792B8C8